MCFDHVSLSLNRYSRLPPPSSWMVGLWIGGKATKPPSLVAPSHGSSDDSKRRGRKRSRASTPVAGDTTRRGSSGKKPLSKASRSDIDIDLTDDREADEAGDEEDEPRVGPTGKKKPSTKKVSAAAAKSTLPAAPSRVPPVSLRDARGAARDRTAPAPSSTSRPPAASTPLAVPSTAPMTSTAPSIDVDAIVARAFEKQQKEWDRRMETFLSRAAASTAAIPPMSIPAAASASAPIAAAPAAAFDPSRASTSAPMDVDWTPRSSLAAPNAGPLRYQRDQRSSLRDAEEARLVEQQRQLDLQARQLDLLHRQNEIHRWTKQELMEERGYCTHLELQLQQAQLTLLEHQMRHQRRS